MYLIALPPNRMGSKVYQLADALVEAKDRAVDVQVVLDRNINWTDKSNLGFWDSASKNGKAYRYLRERGVSVFFDDEAVFTHAKVLVIDEETIILGSANWSEAAFTRNVETNVLIRSEELAEEILKSFETLQLHAPELGNSGAVAVPYAFLSNKKLLGSMVTNRDPRAFDAYLYFLKLHGSSEADTVEPDYETLLEELGIPGRVKEKSHHHQALLRVLKRLRDKYGLIRYSFEGRENPVVFLEGDGEPKGPAGDPEPSVVRLPLTYWEWGWHRKLDFAGKVMYLLGQMYSDLSPTAPVWFRSQADLAERHGISPRFVFDGLMELRRLNLIEVEPDVLNPADYSDRKANEYAPNPLYDPKMLKRAFMELKRKHGKGKTKKAAGYAAVVYEDSDVEGVERLILLEEEFGAKVVKQAVEKVAAMSGNNPKKTMGYLIATIQGIGGRLKK